MIDQFRSCFTRAASGSALTSEYLHGFNVLRHCESQKTALRSNDIGGELVSQAQIRNTLFFIASSIYDFATNII
jgi:hypothetical protein